MEYLPLFTYYNIYHKLKPNIHIWSIWGSPIFTVLYLHVNVGISHSKRPLFMLSWPSYITTPVKTTPGKHNPLLRGLFINHKAALIKPLLLIEVVLMGGSYYSYDTSTIHFHPGKLSVGRNLKN